MKKKLLGLLMLVMCVVLSLGALTACKQTPEKPEGGSWTCYSENKIWTKSLTLKFEDEETFKVYSGSDQWIEGKYRFAKDPGTSTLTLYNADAAIPGVEKDGEKTYEPVDGVYTIEFDHGTGGKSKFLFQPPQDGTKPGEETNQPTPPCDTHVDANKDGKCDVCGADMPTTPTPAEKEVQLTLKSEANMAGQIGKILMYSDNTWEFSICFYGDTYSPMASGTWATRQDWSATDLTVTDDQANVLGGNNIVVNMDASNVQDIQYSATVNCTIPQVGELSFVMNKVANEVENHEQYVVTFDFGNGSTFQALTATFKAKDGTVKQYVPEESAPKAPYIRGKRFAGWDVSATPVLEDGVSKTVYLLGINSNAYFDMGAVEKDVMEITEDTTLYARWVEPQYVSTEAELRNMKNDLAGWYILKNDITLTQDWMPVGSYYASYEHLSTSWWKYAFSGQLDGNGYTIRGLKISTLTPYGSTVHPVDGSGNGTTALFGSVVGKAEISELFIENPVIDIQDYRDAHHGYVSVLAGFVQGDPKIFDIRVNNANISVTTNEVDYIAVCALIGGHWGGELKNCSASGSITVNVNFSAGYRAGGTNLYVGGLVGEGYGWISACRSDMAITLNVSDLREASADNSNNVYMGSIGASTGYTNNVHVGGSVTLDYSQAKTLVTAYVGGIGGIQRNGYLDYSTVDASISVTANTVNGVRYVGSLLGSYDLMSSFTNMHGKNDMKARCCTDKGVVYTLNEDTQEVDFIGFVPKTPQEMAQVIMIAGYMQIDLSSYIDDDGNYTIYGTDRCVKETA